MRIGDRSPFTTITANYRSSYRGRLVQQLDLTLVDDNHYISPAALTGRPNFVTSNALFFNPTLRSWDIVRAEAVFALIDYADR